jgi:hypothetical protein
MTPTVTISTATALEFAEWLDYKCYRAGPHEWIYIKEGKSQRKTTAEMFEMFIHESKKETENNKELP